MRVLLALALVLTSASVAKAQPRQPFDAWLEDLRVEARARGYSDELLGQTLAGLTPLQRVIASDRKQPERTLTFEEYLSHRVTPWMVQRGRELAGEHRELLAQIRERYGVPPEIVLAIWGIESGFGRYRRLSRSGSGWACALDGGALSVDGSDAALVRAGSGGGFSSARTTTRCCITTARITTRWRSGFWRRGSARGCNHGCEVGGQSTQR